MAAQPLCSFSRPRNTGHWTGGTRKNETKRRLLVGARRARTRCGNYIPFPTAREGTAEASLRAPVPTLPHTCLLSSLSPCSQATAGESGTLSIAGISPICCYQGIVPRFEPHRSTAFQNPYNTSGIPEEIPRPLEQARTHRSN